VPLLSRFGQGIVTTDASVLQDGDILYAMVASDRAGDVADLLSRPPREETEGGAA
jgi:trk system potassium uptake protein TrkA